MGVCSISKTYKVSTIGNVIDPFESCRLQLVEKLIFINKLSLKYYQAVETCLLTNDEHKAIILKAKQLLLKQLENFIQQKIEAIDSLSDETKPMYTKQALVEDIFTEMKELIEDCAVKDDVEEIMQMRAENEYLSRLEKFLETKDLEKKLQVREKLKDQAEKITNLNKGSSYQRRRYFKTSLSANEY